MTWNDIWEEVSTGKKPDRDLVSRSEEVSNLRSIESRRGPIECDREECDDDNDRSKKRDLGSIRSMKQVK